MIRLKKIFSFIFEDFHWKLLALVLAVIIWFIGMNMSDPYQNLSVSPRLQLDNIEVMVRENIVVVNEDVLRDINVSVLLHAQRSYMDVLRGALPDADRFAEIVEVSVDFRAVDSAAVRDADGIIVQRLRVSPNVQPGFVHMSVSPAYVDVELDTLQRVTFSTETIQEGEVPPGFELQGIALGNDTVTITGARTDILNISQVRVFVDTTGVHGDVTLTAPLVVLNRYGEDITGRLHLSVSETPAAVTVWRVRPVEIIMASEGELAPGFALAGIEPPALTVEIVGPSEMLDGIEEIIAQVPLQNAAGNTRRMIYFEDFLPAGVYLRRGEIDSYVVTARIEPINERVFSVPRGNVRSRGGVGLYEMVYEQAPIRVNISGPQSMIAALNANAINLEFDLRGLAPGVHTVPLSVELPPGLRVVGTPPALLVQIHQPVGPGGNNITPSEPPIPPDPPTPPDGNGPNGENGNGDGNGENGYTYYVPYPGGYPPDDGDGGNE